MLVLVIFLGALEFVALWGWTSRATGAAIASLPDEDATGLYEPVSFARMNKVIVICKGC